MATSNIFKDGILVDVNVSFWSGAKALTAQDLGLKEEDVPEAYRLGRAMLIPPEVIRDFRKIESKARRIVERNSFPFPIGNARFIPKRRFGKVLKTLKELQEEYNAKTNELISKYDYYRGLMVPMYKEAAETAYIRQTPETHTFGPEYDREKEKQEYIDNTLRHLEAHYPPAESLRKRFSLNWDVYEVALPRMRKGNSDSIALSETKKEILEDEYREQAHQKIEAFMDDVVRALRQETTELCTHIISNIKDGKVVGGKTLNSLKDFVDRFESLNFVGDAEVEQQLQDLRKEILDVYPPEQVKVVPEIQQEISRRLTTLVEAASNTTDINSVTGEYRRRIVWEEELVEETA